MQISGPIFDKLIRIAQLEVDGRHKVGNLRDPNGYSKEGDDR